MNIKTNILSLALVVTLSGCGQMKKYFPDKKKDYQLTSEIPELIIPEDLSGTGTKSKNQLPVNALPAQDDIFESNGARETISVELIDDEVNGVQRIKIDDNIKRSWRMVGKAISSHSIEIIDRDKQEGIYFIQYDPDFEKIEDGSLWNEFLFIFGKDPAKEKKFAIKLFKRKGFTEVAVYDHDDEPASNEAGLILLNLLYKTIKEDLAGN
jgi:outer membrane protein assembly factor BamC